MERDNEEDSDRGVGPALDEDVDGRLDETSLAGRIGV
jgi:hypothetical protein